MILPGRYVILAVQFRWSGTESRRATDAESQAGRSGESQRQPAGEPAKLLERAFCCPFLAHADQFAVNRSGGVVI